MTNFHQNKFSMYLVVLTVLTKNSLTIALIPALARFVASFKQLVVAIGIDMEALDTKTTGKHRQRDRQKTTWSMRSCRWSMHSIRMPQTRRTWS